MRLHTNVDYVPKLRLLYPAHGVLPDVDENDEVYAVQEGNALDKNGQHDRRWQVLFMPAGNVLGAFYTDMGLVSDFQMDVDGTSYPTPPFQQIVLMAHKVAECRDMADDGRNDDFAVKLLHEQTQESAVIEDWRRVIENDVLLIRNASTFGVAGKVERNGYSRSAARRQLELMNDH